MAKAYKCDISNQYMDVPKNGINISGRNIVIPEGTLNAEIKISFKDQAGNIVDLIDSINKKFLKQLLLDINPNP